MDWVLLASLSSFLLTLCVVRSQPRLLWGDELLGYRLLRAPTVGAMLKGWWEGADGGGLFYYLLARVWMTIFGLSERSLRLFSTAGMCTALLLTWSLARRYFSLPVVTLAIAVVYLTPAAMLWQQLNGRFYGLFLASAAWASLLFVTADEQPLTGRRLVATALAHALLIGSHVLGMVYSFSLILGTLALDWRQRRFRIRLLLAELCGWLVVPISFHAIHQSASIAAAGFWTWAPDIREYLLGFVVFGKVAAMILAGLAFLAVLRYFFGRTARPPLGIPLPVCYLMGSLALAQTVLFVKSQFGTSIYADRYLLPVSVGTVLLFAWCFRVLLEGPKQDRDLRAASSLKVRKLILAILVLVGCSGYAVSRRTNYALYPSRGYPKRLLSQVPPGATVVSDSLGFELLSTYDSTHRFVTPYDWFYDLSHDPRTDYSDQRLMQNWKRAGFEHNDILPCGQAFSQPATFYVLVSPWQAAWFGSRIAQDRSYRVEQIANSVEWQPFALWSVRRISPGSSPC